MNINNGRQSIASFIFSHTNNNINRSMVENSRASKSKAFIGVLSKFPQLKRSILRTAMSILLQVYSVDKSYTTYFGMVNLIRWIAAKQLAGAIQALNNRDEASDKFYPPDSDLSVEKELSTF